MKDKIAVVTGAVGSLGSKVSTNLSKLGATVILVDIQEDKLSELSQQLGSNTHYYKVDLLNEDAINDLFKSVVKKHGKIDALFNIAGGFTMGGKTHETNSETFDFMINLNAKSMWLCSRAALSSMVFQKAGKIVNVAAGSAIQGVGEMGPYVSSKSIVMRMTETMAKEYVNDNIQINSVMPSIIDTPDNRNAMSDADSSKWVTVDELSDVMLFLASDKARGVSGANIPVSGRVL